MKNLLLGETAVNQINELIEQGWEFFLHYGDHKTYCNIETNSWEADFTRRLDNGLWDNHKSGYGESADIAVNIAYKHIKKGNRLKG